MNNEESRPRKYVLCRRDADHYNEVLSVTVTPSTIGIVDFHRFVKKLDLEPLELAQFLKVGYQDIDNLYRYGGWIEPHAQENLKLLARAPKNARQFFCRFLMVQDGRAGTRNIPHQPVAF